jgi:hypothetical protein
MARSCGGTHIFVLVSSAVLVLDSLELVMFVTLWLRAMRFFSYNLCE